MCTEQQPKKLGQTLDQDKRTYYSIATPRLQWSWSQYLVKLYTKQCLRTTTQLLQGSSELGPKTQGNAYILQHSYSKTPVELEPKFGQIMHKTTPTYYNTATPRLQWS